MNEFIASLTILKLLLDTLLYEVSLRIWKRGSCKWVNQLRHFYLPKIPLFPDPNPDEAILYWKTVLNYSIGDFIKVAMNLNTR